VLEFAINSSKKSDTGVLAAFVDNDTKVTTAIALGSYRVRNGWRRLVGENFASVVTSVADKDTIRISVNGIYLVFLFASVTGAPVAAVAEIYSTLLVDSDVVGQTTEVQIGATDDVPRQHWQFGVATVAVEDAPADLEIRSYVNASDGTYSLGQATKRDAFVAIVQIA
jgi:hypothetical protein